MNPTLFKLSEDEFDARYKLRRNHLNPDATWAFGDDGGCLFETHGEELEYVRRQAPRTVWTLVDGDNADPCLLSGFHIVNRIGYLLSTIPVPQGTDIQVRIPAIRDRHLQGLVRPLVNHRLKENSHVRTRND
jgi:hypothetical protein